MAVVMPAHRQLESPVVRAETCTSGSLEADDPLPRRRG